MVVCDARLLFNLHTVCDANHDYDLNYFIGHLHHVSTVLLATTQRPYNYTTTAPLYNDITTLHKDSDHHATQRLGSPHHLAYNDLKFYAITTVFQKKDNQNQSWNSMRCTTATLALASYSRACVSQQRNAPAFGSSPWDLLLFD